MPSATRGERRTDNTIIIAPRHAPAFYQRGLMLSRSSSVLGLTDILRRRTAWQQINHALDLDRNNPFYLLELGRIRLKTPILRVEAERFFAVPADIALALQHVEDAGTQLRCRRQDRVLARLLAVTDAGEHIRDGICHHERYILL